MARDPNSCMDSLEIMYKFKLKGKGLLEFHLRCDLFCDRNGVIYFEPHIYFGNMVHTYMTMFGSNPKINKASRAPLEHGDNPEIETSELSDNDNTQKYQSCIGYLQWDVSLGLSDVCKHVMTVSTFRYAPCQGHMDREK